MSAADNNHPAPHLDGYALHELILDDAGHPVDYRFLEVDSGFERLTGLRADQVVDRRVREIFPNIEPHWIETYGQVVLTGVPVRFESYAKELDKHFEVYASCPREGQFSCLFRDVTSDKRTNEAILKRERYYRGLMRNLHEDILVIDRDYRITDINDSALRTVGTTREEVLGRFCYELHGFDAPCCEHAERCSLHQVFATGEPASMHHEHRQPDGTGLHVDILMSPLKDEGGAVTHVVEAARDVSELFLVRDRLDESESRYRSLFENNRSVMLLIDPDSGAIVDANPAAADYYGWTRDELRSKKITEINTLPLSEIQAEMDRASREERTHFFFQHRRADGSVRDVEVFSGPISLNKRSLLGSIVHDITERRQAEGLLQRRHAVDAALAELSTTLLDPQAQHAQVASLILRHARGLTGSAHGYVAHIDRVTGDLVCHTFTEMVAEECGVSGLANPTIFPKGPDGIYGGLWGHALNTRKAFFTNAPSEHACAAGLPEGHIAMGNFLSVPVVAGGDLLGHIALCNCPRGYTDEDLEVIERVAHLYAMFLRQSWMLRSLRESEDRFRAITEQAMEGITLIDGEGRYVFANPAFCDLVKYTEAELRSMTVPELLAPDETQQLFPRVLAGHSGKRNSVRLRRKDGTAILVDVSAGPINFGSKQLSVGIVRDVTDQVQAAKALRDSERRYRSIVENLNDALYVHDFAGTILEVNDNACQMVGYTKEELIGANLADIDSDENSAHLPRRMEQLLREGMILFEGHHVRKDGRPIPVEISAKVVSRDGGGLVQGFVRDTTERKQAEERFRVVARITTDLTYERAESTGAMAWFGDIDAALGYDAGEIPRTVDGWAWLIHQDDLPRVLEAVERCRIWAEPFDEVYRVRRKDGSWRIWEDFGMLLHRGGDAPATWIGGCKDVTVLKEMESRFRQAQKMEAVGQLAGGVAHDFNNMLQAILGYADMGLDDITATHPLYENLVEIRKAAERSSDLTRQLLAFARKQTVCPQALDLNDIVASMLKMLVRLIGENIHLAWLPGQRLWRINMDPSQIDQILANLAVNARDAITGVGSVTIKTENAVLDQAYCAAHPGAVLGEYVQLTVSDDGCGMDKETMAQIFEPFFTTKGVGEGTGLGLATVYGIVKQNNGFITVQSKPRKGSTFRIHLPRFATQDDEDAPERTTRLVPGGSETVLLVEDEAAILSMGRQMLERLGYTVLTASTPQAALRLAQSYLDMIDLCITDVIMPGMNGRELVDQLAARKPGLKSLFMSGYVANVMARSNVLEGNVHFIQKPFSRQDLAIKVRAALERDA